ncbi:hypothetical protein C7T94_04115 [Pedobacter yulinensis]|uniref:DUF6603 domain-containing protein n=1 Tax=Pedobacter yulinensis TaxID=2126353 RepID=A0A2T3HND0_9SPHI|nr:DUF6603 domain-containing protein [Pedobacter yulinensis]PST83936.1 hypothetical protein C7T94_04115 [Pedobacter yulinensis]
MTQSDLLALLQQGYPGGAGSGSMDISTLQNPAYTALFTQLGITSTTIPLNNSTGFAAEGANIVFKGNVNGSFFGLVNPQVTIQFSPDSVNSGAFILLMHFALPGAWTFSQSIPFFAGSIYDTLVLDTSVAPALVMTSGPATDPVNNAAATASGLYFYGLFSHTQGPASFTLALSLLEAFTSESTVFGPVGLDMSVPGQESINMQLALGSGTISNLFGQGSVSLTLSVTLFAGLLPGIDQYQKGVLFTASLAFGQSTLNLGALLSGEADGVLNLEVTGTALAIDESAINTYFGSNNGIVSSLPGQFQTDESLIAITAMNFGIGLTSHNLEYAMMTISVLQGELWNVWMNGSTPVISIGNLAFTFSIFQPFGASPLYEFNFAGIFELGGVVPILIQAQLGNAEDLILSGQLQPGEEPGVAALIAAFYPQQTTVPADLVFEKIDFQADISQGTFNADLVIAGEWEFGFGDNGSIAFEELSMFFSYDSSNTPFIQAGVEGIFRIDQTNQFDIALTLSNTNFTFSGAWKDTGTPITYIDIVMALGLYGLPQLPDIDLSLTGAKLTFDSQNLIFTFELDSKSFGDALIIAGKSTTGAWGFVFGLEATPKGEPINIDITNIPVVGNLVPAGDDTLSITNLRFVGATNSLPAVTLSAAQQAIVGTQLSSGITLSIDFAVGTLLSESFTVRFALSDGSQYDTPPPPPAQSTTLWQPPAPQQSGLPASAPAGSLATWVKVQRSFGPVQIDSVGFQIVNGNSLALLVSGGVSLGGLSIGLTALEAVIPISKPFTPSFSLGGLEVAYTGTGFSVAGGLLTVPGKTPAEYLGNLSVNAGPFGVTAFGMYSTVAGQPSLFAYLAVSVPLGGPPFFFVTGLAGGFGYNAQIQLPTIENVATYPLIQAVTQTPPQSASQVQAELQQLVSTQNNQNWLAAGIGFSSFEMLNSFALLTVSFGNTFAVALMGESSLSVPLSTKDEIKVEPIAEAQMEILIEFLPSNGIFAVNAQLTPSSYVLSKNAKLTGGFAFDLWFSPSPYAGDFVITLGGYNPYYVPQKYYPAVPRLGISWQLSSLMSITGSAYFALTPSVIMAGGSLNAVYHAGNLRAWFTAEADFLIRFKPFSFIVSISVTVGVSMKLNLLFTTTTITLSVGLGLQLWGLPFGGTARMDLSIISISINFGSSLSKPPEVNWDIFTESFLPPPQSVPPAGQASPLAPQALDATGVPVTTTDSILSLSASSGLLQSISTYTWQVDPETFVMLLTLQIPATSAVVNTTDEHNNPVSTPVSGSWNTNLGVGPMGVGPGGLTAALTIQITAPAAGDEDVWVAQAVTGQVASGLWANTTNTMSTDGTLQNVLVGVSLVPVPPQPATTAAIDLSLLLYDPGNPVSWNWSSPQVVNTDPYGNDNPMAEMQSSLIDATVAATRSSWINSLIAQGFALSNEVDVSDFSSNANNLLLSAPALRLAGEEKAESE